MGPRTNVLAIQNWAWYANLSIQALLIFTLYARGLAPRWPRWTACLGVELSRSILLLALGGPGKKIYFVAYAVAEPILLALLIASCFEIYGRRSARFISVGQVGRWLLAATLLLALLASLIATWLGSDAGWQAAALHLLALFRRSAILLLASFAVICYLLFRRYAVETAANAVVHNKSLAFYLLAGSLSMTVMSILGQTGIRYVNIGSLAAEACCYLAWIACLSRQGERDPVPVSDHSHDDIEAAAARWIETVRGLSR